MRTRKRGLCKGDSSKSRASSNISRADDLPRMQEELMAVIGKYVRISPSDIKVSLERQDNLEVLEVKIELPDGLR